MTIFTRTDSENSGFKSLVALLDAALSIIDGDEHAFYARFNNILFGQLAVSISK